MSNKEYIWVRIFILLAILAGSNQIFAQSYVVEPIKKEHGLSHEGQWGYRVILEDTHGFIWIATLNGLNRFDGYEVKQYLSDGPVDRMKIPFQGISALAEDPIGNIWMGGQYLGISIYNHKEEKFEKFEPDQAELGEIPLTQINAIHAHGDYMYISAPFQGVYRYHVFEEKLEKLILRTEEDKQLEGYDSDRSLLKGHIYDFLSTAHGELAALNYQGVFAINDEETRHIAIDHNFTTRNFAEIYDNKILVNSYREIPSMLVDLNLNTAEEFDKIEAPVAHHFLDKENRLWTNYYSGNLTANPLSPSNDFVKAGAVTNFKNKEQNFVLDMIQSRSGDYYFMSITNGAGKISAQEEAFKFIHQGEFRNFALFEDQLHFWKKDSLFRIMNNETNLVPIDIPSRFEISSVYLDRESNYYIAGYNWFRSELFKYDSKYKLQYTHMSRSIDEFFQMDKGNIITDSKEIQENTDYQFVGNYFEKIMNKKFPDVFVHDIVKLQNGEIWCATLNDGIYVLNQSLDSLSFHRRGEINDGTINAKNIKFFSKTEEGYIFCHTNYGINIWNPHEQSFYTLGATEGIKANNIIGIIQDNEGLVWFLTTDKFYSYNLKTKAIQSFVVPEQFSAVENNPSGFESTVLKNSEGIIMFAGANGIVSFDPQVLRKKIIPRPVLITDLYINRSKIYAKDQTGILDSAVLYQQNFTLEYKERNPGFSFVSIEGDDLDTDYYYRLTGLQDDWISIGKQRTIHFTNLDPGEYEFDVMAKSGAGKIVEKYSSLEFVVNAPWYRSIAAYILYGILSIGFILGFVQLRIRNAIGKIKMVETIRTKISADLHDDVGTILAGVAMQAELLAVNPNNESKVELDDLSKDTRNAMEKMRDIVWALDSKKDRYENLLDKMKYFAETNFKNSHFDFNLIIKKLPGGQKIKPDVRQNLYLIFKEAIINAKKHSNGDRVDVELAQSPADLKLSIKDNGNNNLISKSEGAGLNNMKMRAQKIGAQFSLNTEDGFEIIVILNKK